MVQVELRDGDQDDEPVRGHGEQWRAGSNHVAELHLPLQDEALEGRTDLRVSQLRGESIDPRLGPRDGRLQAGHGRLRALESLPADPLAFEEHEIATENPPRVGQVGLRRQPLGPRFPQRRLQPGRVHAQEKLSVPHAVPLPDDKLDHLPFGL